jgi:hypothetical protein
VSLALTNARFANLIPAGHNGRSGMHDEGFRWLELWRELHFSFGGGSGSENRGAHIEPREAVLLHFPGAPFANRNM